MSRPSMSGSCLVVVTGANGLVGSHLCDALVTRGATVRALVRRPGAARELDGVQEWVGDFFDPRVAEAVVSGASAVVTTVHPMGQDADTQRRIAVDGTPVVARAARQAGVARLVHISSAAVYDRSPGVGDVDESSPLVGDDANEYAVTKRDTDAALAKVDGITRVVLRPPAILGPGDSSMWNSLRPALIRDDEQARRVIPQQSFPWVHVEDLASFAADVAMGRVRTAADPELGPLESACTAVNVAAGTATARDYYDTVTRALGCEPVWDNAPAWTGRIRATRARRWGWAPVVQLTQALAEVERGLRA
ncbi:MAG: NAD-dependent epimerase/dehydratase family protein [Dermatophilaceae bacterium]